MTETTQATENQTAAEATEQLIQRGMTPADIRRTREELLISRNAMAELTGISISRIWASEQDDKEISDEHYALIIGALARVREHGLPEHLQPKQTKKTAPVVTIEQLRELNELLATGLDLKTAREVKTVIEQARSVLTSLGA